MASRFVALPVGQGDSFYLFRNGYHFLVDGGRSEHALPNMLMKHVDPPHLDVVVCTHNDADHANGIIGLLQEQPVPIKEVWLPGSWTWRMDDLISRPYRFLDELADDIDHVDTNVNSLEEYFDLEQENIQFQVRSGEFNRIQEGNEHADEWLLDIFERRENRSDDALVYEMGWPYISRSHPWPLRLHERLIRLWLECIDAADRIKKIAEAALHAGARIRLFEFVSDSQKGLGGWPDHLKPVNSHEVSPKRFQISALHYLALTVANKESLVFWAPERKAGGIPGVLFTADNDLACGLQHISQPSTNVIVTAPHHGSESNRVAYTTVSAWNSKEKTIWIRSDSRSQKRPGPSYKNQPKRICTLCSPPIFPKSVVRLHSNKFYWNRTRGTRWCSCK